MKVDKKLEVAADDLIEEIESYVGLLAEWHTIITEAIAKGAVIDDKEYFEKAEHTEYQLEKHANKVIEEATKIKTMDIS